jgi:hypothetical protein
MTFYVEIIQQAGDWVGLCLSLIPYAFICYILYCSWKIASTYPLEFLSNRSCGLDHFNDHFTEVSKIKWYV